VRLQLATLFCFGFFGQMACGAAFGIVPFLSHRRSGLTVGVVAAGGNVGSVVTQVGGRLPGPMSGQAEAVRQECSAGRKAGTSQLFVAQDLSCSAVCDNRDCSDFLLSCKASDTSPVTRCPLLSAHPASGLLLCAYMPLRRHHMLHVYQVAGLGSSPVH